MRCAYDGCRFSGPYVRCPMCKQYFCLKHKTIIPVAGGISRFYEDRPWRRSSGHPCPGSEEVITGKQSKHPYSINYAKDHPWPIDYTHDVEYLVSKSAATARSKAKTTNANTSSKKMRRCSKNECNKAAVKQCKWCYDYFCSDHIDPKIATTARYVWAMDSKDPRYAKYMEDWQKPGGHPCVAYTTKYNESIKSTDYGLLSSRSIRPGGNEQNKNVYYSPKIKKGSKTPAVYRIPDQTRPWAVPSVQKESPVNVQVAKPQLGPAKRKHTKLVLALITLFLLLILAFLIWNYYLNKTTTSGQLGSESDPFQPNSNGTLTWYGPGYYLVPTNIPASGLNQGTNYLSSQTEISDYNQWVNYQGVTVVPTNSSSTSTINTTTISTTTSISTTVSQIVSTGSPISSATWASQFFENIGSIRGTPYNYCPSLGQFAGVRFNTMVSNYGISHYGYDQDFSKFYGVIYNTYFAEEVLYPNLGPYGDTPSSYLSNIQSSAPAHWQLLMSDNYTYYGYDIQNGLSYQILGPNGGYSLCPVTEIPGPNINITQFFAQYGCSVVTTNSTWFVVELASACP